ncbi:MAG TPA: MipA/OmpV family protein [Geminicoccus sp.]|uniref:MipA/OmpV family protein n=1 Tax=Geminicoccus sp. TaxID=2024832 RepID=UPI002E2ECE12|nr:MipA/OmpV family protein [Geminicoccus sp.]HEX2528551.1 MipA/OmpV family protein [Geminicoccus sp.]
MIDRNPLLRKLTPQPLPLLLVAGTILALASSARAQEGVVRWYDTVRQPLSDWRLVAGGGALLAPAYEGSNEFELSPVPYISATFGILTIDTRGATLRAYDAESFSLDLTAGYDSGRDEDDADHLEGLGDVDWGIDLTIKASYEAGPGELYASLTRTLGGSDGLTGTFGAAASHRLSDTATMTLGASSTWADGRYMDSYFSVTPSQSARSGLATYDADAGFKRIDLDLAVAWRFTGRWTLISQVGLGYLLGDAADSPIVEEELQPSMALLVVYGF